MENKKVILYISMSIDGYLATKADDLSWLSIVEKKGEDYGYTAFNEEVDTYIVGKKTYDIILQLTGGVFPQAEKFKCYVLTRTEKTSENGVTFYTGDVSKLIHKLKQEGGKHIYCDGGAEIVKMFMEKDLIDEYIISVIPILLGDGKRLFKGGISSLKVKALPSKYFESGLVQLHYERER